MSIVEALRALAAAAGAATDKNVSDIAGTIAEMAKNWPSGESGEPEELPLATADTAGAVKLRLDGSDLYIRTDGENA